MKDFKEIHKIRVLLIGASGMLGTEVYSKLLLEKNIEVIQCFRDQLDIGILGNYKTKYLKLISQTNPDYVINCAALIQRKSNIRDFPKQFVVNGFFPRFAAKQSRVYKYFMIHVSTDGIFFGKKGGYIESSHKFPRSFYSFSKIFGESKSQSVLTIRCSILGVSPRKSNSNSLLNWLSRQPPNSLIDGYTNHVWNGVTTDVLANLFRGIISNGYKIGGIQHFVPSDLTTKAELLTIIRKILKRSDLIVNPTESKSTIKRNLRTENSERNAFFWNLAGYEKIPTIYEMLNNSNFINKLRS